MVPLASTTGAEFKPAPRKDLDLLLHRSHRQVLP
jgi:hypothetical protein